MIENKIGWKHGRMCEVVTVALGLAGLDNIYLESQSPIVFLT